MFVLIRTIQVDKNASGSPGRKIPQAHSCRPLGNCAGIEEYRRDCRFGCCRSGSLGRIKLFSWRRRGNVSAGICQIGIHADHVRLAIVHGAFIKAPPHLLVGDQKYKRYVKIVSFDTAPWEDLKELITSSAQFKAKSLEL
jgi:hypothetical protein